MQIDRDRFDSVEFQQRLIDWLPQQRWYATKSLAVKEAKVVDVVLIDEHDAQREGMLFVQVTLEQQRCDLYALPVRIATGGGIDFDVSAQFWLSLLRRLMVAKESLVTSRGGQLIARVSGTFKYQSFDRFTDNDVLLHGGQQSNTSVSIGSQFFLKLFRRPQCGLNPDAEIGSFLTERGYQHTPAVAGTIHYVLPTDAGTEDRCVAILSDQLDAESEAWSFFLQLLSRLWSRLESQPNLLAHAPAPLNWQEASSNPDWPVEVAELLQESCAAAGLLGTRTAQLHVALASGIAPEFRPEPLTTQKWQELVALIRLEIGATEQLLKSRRDVIQSIGATVFAESFAAKAAEFLELLTSDGRVPPIELIRVHGDYHLGQVLRARDDFQIIDFEGEPDRPLAERREKRPAYKDVAGMLRSFHYASNASAENGLQAWKQCWFSAVAHEFLRTYSAGIASKQLVPIDPEAARRLLNVFLLEKALYELRYELNNRPDWAMIPIRGLSEVLGLKL